MNEIISIIFETATNLAESILCYYYISHLLNIKYTSSLKYLYPTALFFLLCITNLTISSTILLRITLLFGDIILVIIFTNNSLIKKIFWASSYTLIPMLSESVIFIFLYIVFGNKLNETLTHSLIRYIVILFYLLLCFLLAFGIIHVQQYTFFLPKWLIMLFILIITLGICSSESLFDSLNLLEQYSISSSISLSFTFTCLSLLLVLLVLFCLIIYTGILYKRNLTLKENQKEQQIAQEKLQTLSETNNFLRTWKHENITHLLVCCQMMEQKKYKECEAYLSKMLCTFDSSSLNIQTGNTIIDAVLTVKLAAAEQLGIHIERHIFLPSGQNLPLDDVSISSLLGNALDNMLEASAQVKKIKKEPWISITIKILRESFFLEFKNCSTGNYNFSPDHTLLTTKEKNSQEHGLGLKRISTLVKKASGFYEIQPEPDKFTLTIIIPLPFDCN